jgi:hypothetical protein
MSKVTVSTTHGNTIEVDFDAAVNLMDAEILETQMPDELATEQETVDAYCKLHLAKFGTEFILN